MPALIHRIRHNLDVVVLAPRSAVVALTVLGFAVGLCWGALIVRAVG